MSRVAPPDPRWFVSAFVVGWFAVSALLSRISGWSRLAQQFRSDAPTSGERFRFVSGSMGARLFPTVYHNCLSIAVSAAGFRLSLHFPLQFMSPPLFIPWTEVESIEVSRPFVRCRTAIRLRNHWPVISLYGCAGECVSESFRALGQRR